MAFTTYPTHPSAEFLKLQQAIRSLNGVRLTDALPKSLYELRVWRGVLGLVVSAALYIGSLAAIAHAPHWLLVGPLWLLAGLGGVGLLAIAHECGHHTFCRSWRLNHWVGQLVLLPMLFPFHGWRHTHNQHHHHTNNIELDTDWVPLPAEQYLRMGRWDRLVYRAVRSWLFWFGTVRYQWHSGFKPGSFPQRQARNDVRLSIVAVALFAATYLPLLAYFTGWQGLLLYFVGPWIGIHVWFSLTTLMQHVRQDTPFLTSKNWTPNAARLLLTTAYRLPAPLQFVTHNLLVHTPHHVAPIVPFYNLPAAQAALQAAYPGLLHERRFTLGEFLRVLRHCHLYDAHHGFYVPFRDLHKPAASRRARA